MRKIAIFGGLAMFALACNMAVATPTQLVEMPTAKVVVEDEYNWSLDVASTFGGGAIGLRPGLTYGATEDFEMGIDWASAGFAAAGPSVNVKWRVSDADKDDSLAVGLMGVGPNISQTANVFYAVATLADIDEDDDNNFNFHVGAYYGNTNFLGANNMHIMAGADFGDDDLRGYVEYMGGNNPLGTFSVGVGYTDDDEEFRAILAYQYKLQARTSGITLKLDYFTD